MNLLDIIQRSLPPSPWAEGEKIPWNEPAFSRRMLALHLSQEHDWASRRTSIIETHVDWLERHFLKNRGALLDLGCGPGLYTRRLAERGHRCVGIDFSPASITHARGEAAEKDLDIDYRQQDVRGAEFGDGYDLVMMLFGEFNVFREVEAQAIVEKAFRALNPGGHIVIEAHLHEEVKRQGESLPFWKTHESGLFSDGPHLLLEEHFWDASMQTATVRYWIVEDKDGEVTRYAATMQAYSPSAYAKLFGQVGFDNISKYSNMGEENQLFKDKLIVYSARKPD